MQEGGGGTCAQSGESLQTSPSEWKWWGGSGGGTHTLTPITQDGGQLWGEGGGIAGTVSQGA